MAEYVMIYAEDWRFLPTPVQVEFVVQYLQREGVLGAAKASDGRRVWVVRPDGPFL